MTLKEIRMGKRFLMLCVIGALAFPFLSEDIFAQDNKPGAGRPPRLKVAFALLSTIHDMGWTTAHYEGIEYLKKELKDQVVVDYTENVLAADTERVIRSYAKSGYDIIFGTTFEHMDPMLMVAKDFPNTAFEHCSGYKTAKNMGNYFARMEQAEYLAGYMAGLMGFKNVGTVATQPIPEPIRGINAFTLGLLRGLKEGNHQHDPAKANTVVWLKKWLDPINEVVLAETLINQKHDLIRQMADTPDSARTACYKKVPAIGYGMDVKRYGADCALISTTWNWGPYYVDAVKRVMNKTWKPQEIFWGFKENLIGLSAFHGTVPKPVQEKVLAELKKMKGGKDDSFLGPIRGQEGKVVIQAGQRATDKELLTMKWFAEGVVGKIPE
jgi:basic membrane lipoprotein Med (substrate-binding protein (PBP1-ABC) superfamily)